MRRVVALLSFVGLAARALAGAEATDRLRLIPPLDAASRARLVRHALDQIEPLSLDFFRAGAWRSSDGTILRYRILEPEAVEPGRTYPLVVFFHGSGSIGNDNRTQLGVYGKSWLTEEVRRRFPAFVLAPQFASRSVQYRKGDASGDLRSEPTAQLRAAMELVDTIAGAKPIDTSRIYAVGFSMGASSVWNALLLRPERFAAAVAVAGVPNPDAFGAVRATHLLIVHGDRDDENAFAASMNAFRRLDTPNVEFWRYEGRTHEFPIELLVHPELQEWLSRFQRAKDGH